MEHTDADNVVNLVQSVQETGPELLVELLHKFAYDLVREIEQKLTLFKDVLEDDAPDTKNTLFGQFASSGAAAVPIYGKAIGQGLSKGEILWLQRLDKKNATKLAQLVYDFADHKDTIKMVIMEGAIDTFVAFEAQFSKVHSNGSQKRAMFKLAKDAAGRIFHYLLEEGNVEDFNRHEVTRGVIFGKSVTNLWKTGRSLESHSDCINTAKLFTKTGFFIDGEHFRTSSSNSSKYGYRKLFSWEHPKGVKSSCIAETQQPYRYLLQHDNPNLLPAVHKYVYSKNALEEAKLERLKYHELQTRDSEEKHQELLTRLEGPLVQLAQSYQELLESKQEHNRLVSELSRDQQEIKDNQQDLQQQLDVVRTEVKESQDKFKPLEPREVADLLVERGREVLSKTNKDIRWKVKEVGPSLEAEGKKLEKRIKNIKIRF